LGIGKLPQGWAAMLSPFAAETIKRAFGRSAVSLTRASSILQEPSYGLRWQIFELQRYQFRKNPFRVRLTGSGIRLGCQVFVAGTQARWITEVSESTITAGKGAELKPLLPKCQGVPVVVVSPDGGTSNTLSATR
jgi:hypothetical protein